MGARLTPQPKLKVVSDVSELHDLLLERGLFNPDQAVIPNLIPHKLNPRDTAGSFSARPAIRILGFGLPESAVVIADGHW